MDYAQLAQLYAAVEATKKRLEKTHLIAQFLKACPEEELERVVLLLQARAFPSHEKETLGIASKVMIKTLATTLGQSEKFIEEQWVGSGDLGLVAKAHASKRTQQLLFRQPLTIKKVFDTLRKLATTEGTGSTDTKVKLLSEVFSQADDTEIVYLVRTVLEDLRVGIADGTLRDAIAWAYFPEVSPKNIEEPPQDREIYNSVVERIQDAYDRTNDFSKIAVIASKTRNEYVKWEEAKIIDSNIIDDINRAIVPPSTMWFQPTSKFETPEKFFMDYAYAVNTSAAASHLNIPTAGTAAYMNEEYNHFRNELNSNFLSSGSPFEWAGEKIMSHMLTGSVIDPVLNQIGKKHGADVSNIIQEIRKKENIQKFAILLSDRLSDLKLKLTIGVPVKVMLATREPTTEAAFARTGLPAQLEYKYDGFRVQIHKQGNDVTIFTRRLENVTTAFPDLVRTVRERITHNCILDGEANGIDPVTGHYVPFQQISQRIRRKYDIEATAKELPMQLVIFDVLVWDGKEVLNQPQSERFALLQSLIPKNDHILSLPTFRIASTVEDAATFFREAKQAGCEGIMVKSTTSTYRPGARVGDWVKQKEVMENLDLVIVGGEWGEGKRSGWITSFVLACRDEDGEFKEIGRVGTGLKELPEEGLSFGEVTELLRPHIEYEQGRTIVIHPGVVVEVAYEEIQRSPSYGSGYALRFPRILRNRTDERGPDDVTTLAYVEQLFAQQ